MVRSQRLNNDFSNFINISFRAQKRRISRFKNDPFSYKLCASHSKKNVDTQRTSQANTLCKYRQQKVWEEHRNIISTATLKIGEKIKSTALFRAGQFFDVRNQLFHCSK